MLRAQRVVRTIAAGLGVGQGQHSVTFDATDAQSRAIPDGAYTVAVSSSDPVGNVRVAQAPLTVDTTRPKVTPPKSLRLGSRQAVIVKVTDATSGLRSAVLRYGGRTIARRAAGSQRIIARPARGRRWRSGKLRLTVNARDKAGNTVTRSVTFRVRR